jgi:hypothetical protein
MACVQACPYPLLLLLSQCNQQAAQGRTELNGRRNLKQDRSYSQYIWVGIG